MKKQGKKILKVCECLSHLNNNLNKSITIPIRIRKSEYHLMLFSADALVDKACIVYCRSRIQQSIRSRAKKKNLSQQMEISNVEKKHFQFRNHSEKKMKLDPVKTTAKQNWYFERRTLVVDISYYFRNKPELSFRVEAPRLTHP